MQVFEFENYKEFVRSRLTSFPKGGRGQVRKVATRLKVHSTLVSQILKGQKDLTIAQAVDLSDYLGLNELETDYFLALVEGARAGTPRVRAVFKRHQAALQSRARQLSSRFTKTRSLSEADRTEFYSQWYYCAIRLLTDIPAFQTPEAIAEHLGLSLSLVRGALQFLTARGLVVEEEGRFQCDPQWTFVANETAHATRHHQNWRVKALERLESRREHEISFTLPITHSLEDQEKLAELVGEFVSKVKQLVEPSPPETLSVLTVDLFDVK